MANSETVSTPDKIKGFGSLKRGWYHGSGYPAPEVFVEIALAPSYAAQRQRRISDALF